MTDTAETDPVRRHSRNDPGSGSGAATKAARPGLLTRLWRILLPLIIIALAVVLFIYLKNTKPESRKIEPKEKAWPVAAMSVQPGSWPVTVDLSGSVDALNYALLTAALSADVASVRVIEGDQVRKGQELLVLDDQDARLDLKRRQAEVELAKAALQAEASHHRADVQALPHERELYRLAKAELKRLKDLKKNKLSSQSALDSAAQSVARQAISIARIEENIRAYDSKLLDLQARLDRAQAVLQQAQLQLRRTRIKAPFDGRITHVRVAPGHRVSPGSTLLEMYDLSSLVLRAMLPEHYLGVVRSALSKQHKLRVSGSVDVAELQAELISLGAEMQAGKGGVDALFKIITPVDGLQKGRILDLRLFLPKQQNVVPIPFEGLYGSDKVYLINNENRLQAVFVERVGVTRIGGKNRVLVRAPELVAGSRLLITQLPNALQGLLVEIVDHD